VKTSAGIGDKHILYLKPPSFSASLTARAAAGAQRSSKHTLREKKEEVCTAHSKGWGVEVKR